MVGTQHTWLRVVLVGVAVLAIGSMAPVGGGAAQLTANASGTQSAGAGFAGAVGVEGATLENEQRRRTQNISLGRAEPPAARAEVIASHEIALDGRLDSLEARSARLSHARRIGRIERDQYRAESRVLGTEVRGVERRIELLDGALARLPDRLGTNALETDLDGLAERAHALTSHDDDDGDDDKEGPDTDDDDGDGDDDRSKPP